MPPMMGRSHNGAAICKPRKAATVPARARRAASQRRAWRIRHTSSSPKMANTVGITPIWKPMGSPGPAWLTPKPQRGLKS